MPDVRAIVAEQAEDDGLWFIAATAPEAYLQQELRRLHAAIEAPSPDAPGLTDVCPKCGVTRKQMVALCRDHIFDIHTCPLPPRDALDVEDVRTLLEYVDLARGSHAAERHGNPQATGRCSDCQRFAAIDRGLRAAVQSEETPRPDSAQTDWGETRRAR